jgi:hypothetical protein
MMAWAFETVGVTPSKLKGSAANSNAVPMTSFFIGRYSLHCDLNLDRLTDDWTSFL